MKKENVTFQLAWVWKADTSNNETDTTECRHTQVLMWCPDMHNCDICLSITDSSLHFGSAST